MQLDASSLHDDVKAIDHFTDLCLNNKTCDQFYIYSTWPRRAEDKRADGSRRVKDLKYQAAWELPYHFDLNSTDKRASWNTPSREYTEKNHQEIQSRLPESARVYIIPTGEVLYQLDQKIKAGDIHPLLRYRSAEPHNR